MISFTALRESLPLAPRPWLDAIISLDQKWSIVTRDRAAAFVAQIAHESAQFTHLQENLNYRAERLVVVWPKRFPTLESARPYEHNPEKLANKVYAGRLGNRDEASGDGWRYRGRGPMQLTFHDNYSAAEAGTGLPFVAAPDLLMDPRDGLTSAAWYWKSHGCNELADDTATDDDMADFVRETQIINGGTLGITERIALWKKLKAAFA